MAGADASPGRGDENLLSFPPDNTRKKRALAGGPDPQDFNTTSPKRVALQLSDFSSGVSAVHVRSSNVYRSSPAARGFAGPAGPRRTRAAANLNGAPNKGRASAERLKQSVLISDVLGGEGVHCCMTARLKNALDVSVAKSSIPAFAVRDPIRQKLRNTPGSGVKGNDQEHVPQRELINLLKLDSSHLIHVGP
ncbi:hypothetical protein Purlil1_14228 [Purpureocillium lilacinum]|uniref:Uncharacterized protein n=1 Tax=Purpureocillium lilacinum TaxID=33203 RepID=A0ABR0BBV6_PURLI|nr:hypothetical protein Purlil1_14228 [Purpureocillium lilacinum]